MGFEVIHQPKSKDVFSFRVFPWQMLMPLLGLPSVSLLLLHSVFFRVNPWPMLLLSLLLGLPSVANASAYAFATLKTEPFRVYTLIKIGGMDKMFCFFYWHPLFI